MRLVIAFLPGLLIGLALAGCDRQKAAGPQGNAPAAAVAPAPPPPGNVAAPGHPRYPTGRLDRSHAGTAAPDTAFEDGNGRPMRLSAFRGRPLLVNLWATWCGPCVVEMPSLDALALRQGDAIKVLTVSQDADDGRRKVADFFAARNFQRLEPHLDSRMDLMMGLRLDTLPTTILYDAQGREVWRMTGMADWSGERAARLLREANPG
ncbi:MAG TPA: TlpA disulfide reductase family protein [Allosphingosinicella sp.]|nr:TlpA disulfide reductase family protein [Allosphingosinicella sp.]